VQSTSFAIFDWNFWTFWALDISLERYFQDLSNGVLHVQKFQSKIAKQVDCVCSGPKQNRG